MQHPHIHIQAGQLYTPCEVRAWLKISRTTLWRYQKAGALHPVRIGGGSPRFRGEEILAVVTGGGQDAAANETAVTTPSAPKGTTVACLPCVT